jgi:pimeloyl-ACP methyl ester carboxylesterase
MNRSVQYEGIKVEYSDSGKGQAIVLLHGYLETSDTWQSLTDILVKTHRVIAIDLPGHGGSGVAGETHTMEFLAGAVRKVIFCEGEEKVLLVGHSLGGYVTLAFAEMYPGLLAGYVLFHSHAHADSPDSVRRRQREIAVVRAGKKNLMYPANIAMMFAEKNLPQMQLALDRAVMIASRNSSEGIIALLNGMIIRPGRECIIEEGSVPLLWILGKCDQYFSPEKALGSTKIPEGSEVVILENSGHLGFIEETVLSAEIINKFAARLEWSPATEVAG